MKAKRKLLISMLAIVFVLLAVVATIAIAFALTQQTITTTLNIGYVVEDIDGTASATYTIGGVTESLTAMKGNQVIGDTLVFHAGDTEDAGNLMFPEGQIPLSAQNDNIVIQYTYSNTGAKHYIASMSFDGNISADNMKVEYSINGTDYSENRYAVVVPANTSNKSYWIKISIENKAKSASFTGDFRWLLNGCDPQEDSYLSLTSLEFTGSNGRYSASVASEGEYAGELVFPSSVNGDPVTTILGGSMTQEQKNQITSVYIPDSIKVIGDCAFSQYTSLKSIRVPGGVTFDYDFHFSGCTSLETVVLEEGVRLGASNHAIFQGCTALKEITIPSTLGLCYYGFEGCTALEKVNFADGWNFAGFDYMVFGGCTSLKEFVVPSSVKTLDDSLFYGCTSLERVVFAEDSQLNCIYLCAFQGCTALKSIIIPETVTEIGDCAFAGSGLISAVFKDLTNWKIRSYISEDRMFTVEELADPSNAARILTTELCVGGGAVTLIKTN